MLYFNNTLVYLSQTHSTSVYNETCVIRPLPKRPKIGRQDQSSLNAGQKFFRILSTYIKLLGTFVIKILVLSVFVWPFKTGFIAMHMCNNI